MAEALVSLVLKQLASFTYQQIEHEWSLVSSVEEKVDSLCGNLEDIQMVLVDADRRQICEATVKRWLNKLKAVSYEIDTAVDEWNAAITLRSDLKLFDKLVQTVGNEFLGIEDTTTETPAAFPKLKRLHFQEFREWIEWKSDVSSDDQIMPCLQSLKIEVCPKLKPPLPRFLQRTPPLKTLTIKKCPGLQPRLDEGLGTEENVNILTSVRITESEESSSIE
ncbi:uncharacterized protein LOC133819839 isoform X2 [Humulus lupulus]|uniref:uncharacterized protein LOC133819839 isoform X2 n=1 Tax=Humulus lupulus TaxID=3486 RepID=UPI002B407F9F|nr:uncharacterized protein LOC133819839 isoform X2 [Humulus lupulus]